MNQKEFIQQFQNEHRQIRTTLWELLVSLVQRDITLGRCYLKKLDKLTGPHFRYEEETLFPALMEIYDSMYVNKLFTDHDLVIMHIKKLCSTLNQPDLTEEDYTIAIKQVKSVLPIVSSCESISAMIEKFNDRLIEKLNDTHNKAYHDNFSLFKWSETVRKRLPLYLN